VVLSPGTFASPTLMSINQLERKPDERGIAAITSLSRTGLPLPPSNPEYVVHQHGASIPRFEHPTSGISGQADENPSGGSNHQPQEALQDNALFSRASPELAQADYQGHYVGSSSGAAFFLRARRRLGQTMKSSGNPNNVSSIFTFGDAPFPEFDAASFILPPYEEALSLLDRYFNFAMPTYHFLDRERCENWLSHLYKEVSFSGQLEGERDRNAVLFMIFAIAQRSYPAPTAQKGLDSGSVFLLLFLRQLLTPHKTAPVSDIFRRQNVNLTLRRDRQGSLVSKQGFVNAFTSYNAQGSTIAGACSVRSLGFARR
jgi:hypothetical protein